MIRANHKKRWELFFRTYTAIQLKRHFHKIVVEGDYALSTKPILLISNHFSFWDGFIHFYLNDSVFHKKIHVMMLHEQLLKHRFLQWCGAFSVQRGRRDIIESLKYSCEVLTGSENLLVIFPQGEIHSQHHHNLSFGKGVHYLLEKCGNEIQIVFNVNLADYYSQKRPTLTCYLKEYKPEEGISLRDLENDFNLYLRDCIYNQRER